MSKKYMLILAGLCIFVTPNYAKADKECELKCIDIVKHASAALSTLRSGVDVALSEHITLLRNPNKSWTDCTAFCSWRR